MVQFDWRTMEMALSTGLNNAKVLLDGIEADSHPTPYNQKPVADLIAAMRLLITEIDVVENL